MTIRTLLKFRNLDLTKDLNDRFTSLLIPGVFDGGDVTAVPAQLKVDVIAPWKLVNKDGMVVEETNDNTRLDCPAGQTTAIVVRAVYNQNNDPEVEVLAIELSAFNLLPDIDDHIVFATVVVPIGAVSVLSTYIKKSSRNIVDKLGRNIIRGTTSSTAGLPSGEDSIDGDLFVVAPGGGNLPNIYGWDGTQWLIMTDAVTVTNDLIIHRTNNFVDEKHATDDEKLALVGTSGTPPSGTNPFVDDADTRIPTQAENDALVGSDGAPSSANKYITQEFALAVPEEKVFASAPVLGYTEILDFEGPVYVGLQGTGSSNSFFLFYDSVQDREYTTSTGLRVLVDGVFLDAGLTTPIDPSINPNVDAKGFFSGAPLYIKYDVVPDTGLNLNFGRKKTFEVFPIEALMLRSPGSTQASSDVVTTVEKISGRDWDDTPPTNEQNIELRKDVVDLKEYVSSVFNSDFVVGNFDKVDGVPDFNNDFITNIGIPPNYSFENTGLVAFSYDPVLGKVTFVATVANGSVIPGNVFIDGIEDEYTITGIPSGTEFTIARRNGVVPLSINTTNTTSAHGSAKPDNNPRKTNLSTLNYVVGRERIHSREIEVVQNEYHPRTGNVAFQIRTPLRSAFFREPRVRFYGGFQNRDTSNRKRVVATNLGIIMITGYFTDCRLLVDLQSTSPIVTVKVDGDPTGTAIDLSRTGNIADLGSELDIQQQSVEVATGLTDNVPHTIEIEIANATGDFIIYGLDLFRLDTTTTLVLPGRAFVQSDLYKSDATVGFLTPQVSTRSRGAVSVRFINRALGQQTTTIPLTDLDGIAGGPAGVAVAAVTTFTVSSGFAKFAFYRPGDIVKVITATAEEVKQIDTIGPGIGVIEFTTAVTSSGAAILIHVASPAGDSTDPTREYARYGISEMGVQQGLVDFGQIFLLPSSRLYTLEDGTTSIAGQNIRYTTTGIDGVGVALEMIDGTSTVRIRAVATRMDILTVNTTSVTADVQIDGSPVNTITIPGGGLSRVSLWTNARYQTHEVLITAGTGVRIASILLHEPVIKPDIEGSTLATQNIVANHDSSRSVDGSVIPTGSIAVDPHTMGGVFINGTGVGTNWTHTVDFVTNPYWGRFITNDREGSTFEYFLIGSGFEMEYFVRDDFGRPFVFINGTLATAANFGSATFKGINSATGKLDMYDPSSTTIRKKMMVTGLPYGKQLIRIEVQTPRDKNPASFGTSINIGTFYEIGDSSRLSYTPSRGFRGELGIEDFVYGMDWARDERNFDSGAIAREEVPVIREVLQPTRAQAIAVGSGATSIAILFSSDFGDSDYAVTANLYNDTDTFPEFQPITITARSSVGFTAKWNDPLDTANYTLNYTAIKFL